MPGDYNAYRRNNQDKTADVTLAATDGGKNDVIAVKNANNQLFIQRISYVPVTVAAQSVTFKDDNSSALTIAVVPSGQTLPFVADFGPEGVALTAGKNLDISNTAGPAAQIKIEAYQKLVSPATLAASAA